MRNGLEYLYFDINVIDTKCVFRTKTIGDDTRNLYLNNMLPQNFYFTVDFREHIDSTELSYKSIGWTLGFKQPVYIVNQIIPPVIILDSNPFVKKTYDWYLKSESSYGNSLQNYLFLEIDDSNTNFTSSVYSSKTEDDNYLNNNILDRLTITSGIYTVISMNNENRLPREYFSPVRIDSFHIRLIDKYGVPVNLNGNDFSFALEIGQLYSV